MSDGGHKALAFFGILEILLGILSGLLGIVTVGAVLFGSRLSPAMAAVPRSALVLNFVVYAGASVFLFATGLGTIRARRWARALMLVAAWPALLGIVLGGAMLAFVVGSVDDDPAQVGPVMFVLVCVCAVLALVPLSFIVFYSRPGVRHIFETADPRPTWVDDRPLPILAVALALWAGGAGLVATALQGVATPFGYVITGWPAVAIGTLNGLVWIWLGRQIYWMTRAGWWASLAWGTVAHLSLLGAFFRLGTLVLDPAARGTADAELLPLARTFSGPRGEWLVAISLAIWIGTLLWLRRFYRPEGNPLRSRASLPC